MLISITMPTTLLKKQTLSKRNLLAFLALFILFGIYLIYRSLAANGDTANIWIASNGNDAGSNCKRFSTPTVSPDSSGVTLCKSFSAALGIASGGDSIRVLPGTYGSQSVTRNGLTRDSNFDNNIQFIADGGPGSVTLAGLSIGSSTANTYGGVNFDGFHVTGGPAIQEAKDIRLSNFEANNQTYISNSQDIKLEKYTVQPLGFPSVTSAPFSNGWGIGIVQQSSGSVSAPSNITLDGINMHGVRATQSVDHPDGVFMWRGGGVPSTVKWTGMNVRNSLFYNNECINWRYNDANPAQVEFENNFFDSSVNGISGCGYYSISVASASGIYRNNTIKGGIQVKEGDCPGTCGANRAWKNNIILGGWSDQGCSNLSSDTWSKNILDGSRCSTNDTNTTAAAIKFAGGNSYPDSMFVTTGSAAIDNVPSDYPSNDFLGTSRPQGSAADAGAYEYKSSTASNFSNWSWDARNATVATNSATAISKWIKYAKVSPNAVINSYAVATAVATASDPTYSIPLTDQGGSISVRIPLGTKPDPGGDGHLTVRDVAAGTETDFWQAKYDSTTQRISSASAAIKFPLGAVNEGTGGWGGNAANTPLRRGLITPENLNAGVINETLQISHRSIGGNSSSFKFPGLHNQNTCNYWYQTDAEAQALGLGYSTVADYMADCNANYLPEGTWMRLDPSINIDAITPALPAWQKTVAKAMQNHGMIIRDNGGTLGVYGENTINRGGTALWNGTGIGTGNSTAFASNFPWDKMQVLNPPPNLNSTTTCSAKQGDVNKDGLVDVFDLSILLSAYGKPTTECSDINRDGKVDMVDLSSLLTKYGT